MLATIMAAAAGAASLTTALVVTDQSALRASPKDSAPQQAVLRQGELLEIRGERLDYVQVYDYQRERGGFVRASQVRRLSLTPAEAPELLTVLRFVKDNVGQEALGIGVAAAWLKSAPAPLVQGDSGVEVLDTLGTLSERLAARASTGTALSPAAEATLAAHLDVARHYGVRFASYEREGRMLVCYDGDAYRRVLAMAAKPQQQANAALGLTRPECVDPNLRSQDRLALDQWRAEVLDKVNTTGLTPYVQNRVQMRRASVWSALAYQQSRLAATADAARVTGLRSGAQAAAEQSFMALASVNKTELPDEDQPLYNDAAMRVNASRWAAVSGVPTGAGPKGLRLTSHTDALGETCVQLIDAQHDASKPLLRRCTYGLVWTASATINREGTALALAVQPMSAWRELWVFRKQGDAWSLTVLPPATTNPDMGYAEFAGWVPGGRDMLVAREARGEGKYTHHFAVLQMDSMTAQRQSSDASSMGPFQRWADPAWKRSSVSVR